MRNKASIVGQMKTKKELVRQNTGYFKARNWREKKEKKKEETYRNFWILKDIWSYWGLKRSRE